MKSIIRFIKKILGELRNDRVGAYAAQTAFFLFLSVIPYFIFLITLVKFTPLTENSVTRYIENYMPEYIAPVLVPIINEIYASAVSVMTISIIGAIWASAKGIHSMTDGLNSVYGYHEKRNFFILRFRAILYTFIFTILTMLGIISAMYGRRVKKLIRENVSFFDNVTLRFKLFKTALDFRYILFFIILSIIFVLILKFLPSRKRKFKYMVVPAILAALCWTLLSWGISVYINYFGGFSMYGSMMALMLAIIWIYFGMYILFIAAELDSMYSERIFLELKRRKIERKRNK
ncbi:MAG: YihY/virulence factor BrkB family protein [Lachnospiraceae bacterium]|nr:YihY/virulence factor BrkB family protein [Lachnospiraceae bacterium]MBR5788972.1 YihY/virulence factor BrkB family protein [Lachnospiraceae bacterium]